MQYAIYTASRLSCSTGSLKYGQPRYTSHLVWHGLLARCLLQKTRPEMWPLAILCTGQYTAPKCLYITVRYDVLSVVWHASHLNREHNDYP